MARESKELHVDFINYMEFIVEHPNYNGLPIKRKKNGELSWFAPANTSIGALRKKWCENKALELGFPIQPGVYSKVMLEIHPTKKKICQTCGNEMSLYYHYPSSNFVKSINQMFNSTYCKLDHISYICQDLQSAGYSEDAIKAFLISKSSLSIDPYNSSIEEIIYAIENLCRNEGKKLLSPGAMSNFPDRYDGFHTYNLCCRSKEDKGRSKENMKSYTKDRRAYEYWSDGNIHAANQFMGSSHFDNTSADHIGPISLGFVHDPRYLTQMNKSDNSSKRDRLLIEDVDSIIKIHKKTNVYPISWFSSLIWEHIVNNYKHNPEKVESLYRNTLKQNMSNFMFILYVILNKCHPYGERLLTTLYLSKNYECFNYDYEFDTLGNIVTQDDRHHTERTKDEFSRYVRIAMDAVQNFNNKENRNVKPSLDDEDLLALDNICNLINKECKFDIYEFSEIENNLNLLMQQVQIKLIRKL